MGVSRRMRMGRGGWEGCHGVVRATLCARRARAIVSVRARGLIKGGDLGAGVEEVAAFGEMRRSYQAMVEAERLAGRPRRFHTTRPNEGHKAVWGPRISSAAGNWFKAQWKTLVLERMRGFRGDRGDPMATMAYYLGEVMPGVWSQLLAAHAVRA